LSKCSTDTFKHQESSPTSLRPCHRERPHQDLDATLKLLPRFGGRPHHHCLHTVVVPALPLRAPRTRHAVDAFDAPPRCFTSLRDTKPAASLVAELKPTPTAS
jgi:hypothetical protein